MTGRERVEPDADDGQFDSQDMPVSDGEFADADDSQNGFGQYEARNFGATE